MSKAVLSKRLGPLYLATFLQSFMLWYAIEKVFMKSIGFSDGAVVNATILFTVITLSLSIPVGIVADRWSRRGVLIIASVLLAIGSAICGLSTSVGAYTIGLAVWGAFSACYSGMYDSLIYDILLESDAKSPSFEKLYGRFELYNTVAFISGALISGLIGEYLGLRQAYMISVPIALGAVLPLLYFKEPSLHKNKVNTLLGAHIRDTLFAVIKRREILWVCLGYIVLGASARILLEFGTLWFVALALPTVLFGPATAIIQSSIGFCGFVAEKIKSSRLRIVTAAFVSTILGLILTTHSLPAVIPALSLILLLLMALSVILMKYMHQAFASNLRVGASSVVYTLSLIGFMPMAYIFGRISDHASIFNAAWMIVAMLGVCSLVVMKVVNTETSSSAAAI